VKMSKEELILAEELKGESLDRVIEEYAGEVGVHVDEVELRGFAAFLLEEYSSVWEVDEE